MSQIKWADESGQVKLGMPSDLDLPVASSLVDSLRHGFAVGESVEVLAESVERVSAACIQALVAASRHAADHGQKFVISSPSVVMIDICADLGLASWLNQWSRS
ncbi:STAS domain-containing protein [uncultured Gammaproteobacteria bacterium]